MIALAFLLAILLQASSLVSAAAFSRHSGGSTVQGPRPKATTKPAAHRDPAAAPPASNAFPLPDGVNASAVILQNSPCDAGGLLTCQYLCYSRPQASRLKAVGGQIISHTLPSRKTCLLSKLL